MNKNNVIGILFFFFLMFFHGITAAESVPTVQLKYAYLFDPVCSQKTGYKIEHFWITELKEKLPKWQILWNKEGVLLLKKAMKITGKSFRQNYYIVPLSLCNFPSMSEPLIINARYSLRHFTNNPIDASVTISTIEHEILHTHIDSFFSKKSPLLIKYQHESKTVLNHLHLFALMKATYLSLGWNKKLEDIISKDNSLPNGDYKRAWEIVNIEGFIHFVNELKSH